MVAMGCRQIANKFSGVLFLTLVFNCPIHPSPREAGRDGKEIISVRLSLPRTVVVAGESAQVVVEITNDGDDPVLVENLFGAGASQIKFNLSDSNGVTSPGSVNMVGDYFASPAKADPLEVLLKTWLLLRPKYSLLTTVKLDGNDYSFLAKPGKYHLYATYASTGLSYPPTYMHLGLTKADVDALKYESWSGKIRSNEVSLKVVSATRHSPPSK
jgi:hypothetical protein